MVSIFMKSNKLGGYGKTLVLLAVVGLAAGGYLFTSQVVHEIGFPLDDAWIHQTYARNLALQGEFAFNPGQVSAGSTSPLWTALLALGYYFRGNVPYAWTFLLGILSLLGLAAAGQAIFDRETGQKTSIPWAGIFLAGEWHLLWASVSGMETALMGCFVLLSIYLFGRLTRRLELAGLVVGLAVWVRPDGLTLLGPALFVLLLGSGDWKLKLKAVLRLAAGFGVFFIPYLLFNWRVQGSFWPNTFYAKQAEYESMQQVNLLLRFWNEVKLPMIGGGALLLPGFLYITGWSLKERRWLNVGMALFFLGYAAIYAWRLPVVYQYGRYLMPVMPVYFVSGLVGTTFLLNKIKLMRLGWVLSRVLIGGVVAVWLMFAGIGAARYAQDVAIIDTEMVQTAHWVASHTQPGALVAAHDIGALGYFGDRKLLDLAGLISPEVIPFIRNEAKMESFLDEKKVDYLVTFPSWYSELVNGKQVIYQSDGIFSIAAGGENMTVYSWK